MKKRILFGIFCATLGIIIFIIVSIFSKPQPNNAINPEDNVSAVTQVSDLDLINSAKNATYIIEGQAVTLSDGNSEISLDGESESKTITQYFGNEVISDFDGDGRKDVAFILTQNGGGSGTFYYVVLALNTKDGFAGTNAFFIGDRIAPQTTEVKDNNLIVNFADRRENQSFAESPSIGKTLRLKYNPNKLELYEIK